MSSEFPYTHYISGIDQGDLRRFITNHYPKRVIEIDYSQQESNQELRIKLDSDDKDGFWQACLQEFPGNCSWAILYSIQRQFGKRQINLFNFYVDLCTGILENLEYSHLLISVSGEEHMEYLKNEFGFNIILNNINNHGGNEVWLLAKELKVPEDDDGDHAEYF